MAISQTVVIVHGDGLRDIFLGKGLSVSALFGIYIFIFK